MDKDLWYENRILWRSKRFLKDQRCSLFSNLNAKERDRIGKINPNFNGKAIFVLFFGECEWTVLTTREVVSYFDNELHRALFDRIEGEIEALSPINEKSSDKRFQHRMNLVRLGVEIRAPAGSDFFTLWGILQMFPLKVP